MNKEVTTSLKSSDDNPIDFLKKLEQMQKDIKFYTTVQICKLF